MATDSGDKPDNRSASTVGRTARGTFAKGHTGNAGGRPKDAHLREKCRKLFEKILDDMMANPLTDERSMVTALDVCARWGGMLTGAQKLNGLLGLLALKEKVKLTPEETQAALNAIEATEEEMSAHGPESSGRDESDSGDGGGGGDQSSGEGDSGREESETEG